MVYTEEGRRKSRFPAPRFLVAMPKRKRMERKIHPSYGPIASVKDSLGNEDGQSQGDEKSTCLGANLPEDIWCHIHSLMPLRNAACSAFVCRTFLRSWRCHPKLTLTEEELGLEQKEGQKRSIARGFIKRVDQILKNHSGAGVKTLKLVIQDFYNVSTCHLNSWLQKAITPGIEEIVLGLPTKYREEYYFPCSVFLDGCGKSIRYLYLTNCVLRPSVGFNCLRSLTELHLYQVRITGDELSCLISSSFALEDLKLTCCHELIYLKIPFHLEHLSFLYVSECYMLKVIESAAPNLSTFDFFGEPVQFSFGESSQVRKLTLGFSFELNTVAYAITKLPSVVPCLETLTISSTSERVNTPMVADKFLRLKHLDICLGDDDDGAVSPSYDYFSLVSFLDACPVLESLILNVDQDEMMHDSIIGHASQMRQIPELKHERLKNVQVNGFCSAKSMVELICHILENATSLESLTLDTIVVWKIDCNNVGSNIRCSTLKSGKCKPTSTNMVLEAHKALSVIKKHIVGRVPSTVTLNVGEPCSRCHSVDVTLT